MRKKRKKERRNHSGKIAKYNVLPYWVAIRKKKKSQQRNIRMGGHD